MQIDDDKIPFRLTIRDLINLVKAELAAKGKVISKLESTCPLIQTAINGMVIHDTGNVTVNSEEVILSGRCKPARREGSRGGNDLPHIPPDAR